jgi:hypothetical protein
VKLALSRLKKALGEALPSSLDSHPDVAAEKGRRPRPARGIHGSDFSRPASRWRDCAGMAPKAAAAFAGRWPKHADSNS